MRIYNNLLQFVFIQFNDIKYDYNWIISSYKVYDNN